MHSRQRKPRPLVKPWFTLQSYVSLVMVLALAFGVAFQMPLVVFFLGRLGLVKIHVFRHVRKYVLLGIVVFSAMITPPDVISQVAMSVPMYLLYELGTHTGDGLAASGKKLRCEHAVESR